LIYHTKARYPGKKEAVIIREKIHISSSTVLLVTEGFQVIWGRSSDNDNIQDLKFPLKTTSPGTLPGTCHRLSTLSISRSFSPQAPLEAYRFNSTMPISSDHYIPTKFEDKVIVYAKTKTGRLSIAIHSF